MLEKYAIEPTLAVCISITIIWIRGGMSAKVMSADARTWRLSPPNVSEKSN